MRLTTGEAAGCCISRNLPFGTGCAPRMQVLLLERLPEDDDFGSRAATGEIRRVMRGFGGPRRADHSHFFAANREIARAGTAQP